MVDPTQDGTDGSDELQGVAVGSDGSILLAGRTSGTWTTSGDEDSWSDYAVVSIDGGTLTTPAPEATTFSTDTPSIPGSPPTVPTPVPQSSPATAAKATQGPLFGTPLTTNATPAPSSRPKSTEAANSYLMSDPSAFVIGGIVAGAIVLVILGILAYQRLRGKAATNISNPMEPRQFPFAARADGPSPPPPSYPQVVTLRP